MFVLCGVAPLYSWKERKDVHGRNGSRVTDGKGVNETVREGNGKEDAGRTGGSGVGREDEKIEEGK